MSIEADGPDKRVLCVGLICLDIVSVCKKYPVEDSDQRSVDYYWQRGGNASNSCTVLALLGENVECLGTLVEGPEMQFLTSDFRKYGIGVENCAVYPAAGNQPAVAISVISQETGSRTIMAALKINAGGSVSGHPASFSGGREVTFEDFDKLDLTNYKWIHFEGRPNPEDHIGQMMAKVQAYNASIQGCQDRITVSLELEKVTRPELKCLCDRADYVFFSKDFAMMEGYTCKEDAAAGLVCHCKHGTVICAWGDDGAAAKPAGGSSDVITSPVFPPENLCDTLGAGDTFNGATIFALSQGRSVKDAIVFGCRVAGAKCGMRGYSGLKGMQT